MTRSDLSVRRSAVLIALLISLASTVVAAEPQSPPPAPPLAVSYRVSADERQAHLVDIGMRIDNIAPTATYLDLQLPVWAPGSYLVREFARHVQDERAVVAGANAPIEKTAKNTWRVLLPAGDRTGAARTVDVSYRVYANDLTVRTSHVDADHVYLNGSNVFMHVVGATSLPVRVVLQLPSGWKVATGLRSAGPDAPMTADLMVSHSYTAPDYDTLVDCPIEAAPDLRVLTFTALGKPHEIAVWGASNLDTTKLVADAQKIVAAAAAVFDNTLPYDRYVFIVQLFPGGGGGLEHANSTVCQANPWGLQKAESYRNFLELLAHEYFHAWLVKRIHPPALGPFDYTSENYTRMLWLMEGTTDYYASLLVKRAGLMSEDDYWKDLGKQIANLERTPGRKHQSVEEASFDAWIKYYRQNEHSQNSQVSYYLKGMIVTALLDLEIQGRTKGAKSFDDVLRYLWATYGKRGLPVPEDGVEPAVEAAAGSDFTAFFDAHVRGRAEIDYNAFLVHVGRKLVTEVPKNDDRVTPAEGGWIGATLNESGGRTTVSSIAEGSPAWLAGLSAGDEVLAVDGFRVTGSSINDRMSDRTPGDLIRLTIFRRDQLLQISIKLVARPADTYRIEKIEAEKPKVPKSNTD